MIPNIITLARIALVPVFMACMAMEDPQWRIAALVVFSVASATDFIDGYLARKMGQVTNFGKVMDPLADKLLILAALIYFVRENTVAVWVVVVILGREFIISTLRIVAASAGTVLGADLSGKIKTVVQISGVIAVLSPWHMQELWPSVHIYSVASWVMAIVTVWSGLDYLIRHWPAIKIMD